MGCSGSKNPPPKGDVPSASPSATGNSGAPASSSSAKTTSAQSKASAAAAASAVATAVGEAANTFFGNESPALGDLRIAMARNDVQRLHQEQTRVGGPTADAQREAAELRRREEEESPAGALKKAWVDRRKAKAQQHARAAAAEDDRPDSAGDTPRSSSPDTAAKQQPQSVRIEVTTEPSSPIPRQATASPLSYEQPASSADEGQASPQYERRGVVTEAEKQNVRNKATATLLGSASAAHGGDVERRRSGGSPYLQASPSSAVAAAPEGRSRSIEPERGNALADLSSSAQQQHHQSSSPMPTCAAASVEQTKALLDDLTRSKKDRDTALAAAQRVQSELDQARTELVYLRAAAEATDNFHDLQRIPPQWVPSQLQTMAELRRRVALAEEECVILKSTLREQQQQQQQQQLQQQHSWNVADGGSPNDDMFLPSSPTALVARVRELQVQLAQGHAEVERLASARAQAAAQLHEVESAVSQAQETESTYRATIRTLLEKEQTLQQQLQDLQANADAAASASKATGGGGSSSASSADAVFLKQLSSFLITAEHCPEATRMELLQYCCEHSGLAVAGKPALVTDPEVFDMNGVLYGDCLAFLSSLIIQRRESRIVSLILSETSMSDLGAAQLALTLAVLSFETPLSLINVSNNEISFRGALQLLTALGTAGGNKAVRKSLTLDLDNNPIYHTVQDVRLLTEQLAHMQQHFPQIKVQLPRVPKSLESQLLRSTK